MSLKRLAVVSAVGSHNSFNNQTISYVSSYSGQLASSNNGASGGGGGGLDPAAIGSSTGSGIRAAGSHHHQGLQTMRPGANLHGNVNIMLGGAMLSVVITVVCFVCYCCHRNIKKRSNSLYRQQWLETEANMEIYSVEQCYDPPPSSAASGFFLDGGSSGGDYQALPVNVNHPAAPHFPFPYHHHALHYPGPLGPGLGYPNGPPPSYDAVVAQDELLAAASRRKTESFHGATESGDGKAGAPKGTFRRVTRIGGRDSTDDDDDDDGEEADAGEPLWRGDDAGATASGCSCTAVSTIAAPGSQVLPVYCRNCGYFVEPSSSPELPPIMVPGAPVGRCIDTDHHRCHPPSLVDYETQPAAAADTINRNIVIDGGGTPTGKHPVQNDGLDAMNNNGDPATAGPSANEPGSSENNNIMRSAEVVPRDDGPGGPERLTGMPCGPRGNDANLIDMRDSTGLGGDATGAVNEEDIRQYRIMSNQDMDHTERQGGSGRISYLHAASENRRQATEDDDQANGNGGGPTSDVSRQLLRENGVLRLDMSQIIDNTGLPTYEAALKLESSGYV